MEVFHCSRDPACNKVISMRVVADRTMTGHSELLPSGILLPVDFWACFAMERVSAAERSAKLNWYEKWPGADRRISQSLQICLRRLIRKLKLSIEPWSTPGGLTPSYTVDPHKIDHKKVSLQRIPNVFHHSSGHPSPRPRYSAKCSSIHNDKLVWHINCMTVSHRHRFRNS